MFPGIGPGVGGEAHGALVCTTGPWSNLQEKALEGQTKIFVRRKVVVFGQLCLDRGHPVPSGVFRCARAHTLNSRDGHEKDLCTNQ